MAKAKPKPKPKVKVKAKRTNRTRKPADRAAAPVPHTEALAAEHAEAHEAHSLPSLEISVTCRDISNMPEAELLVVGRYSGTPLTGAVGSIDQAMQGKLSNAADMGMFNSELGELFYCPLPGKNAHGAPRGVMVAGMGEPGQFGREDLAYLMTNVGAAALEFGARRLSSVLIGTEGNVMTAERSLRAILDGLRSSMARYSAREGDAAKTRRLMVEIVEVSLDRFLRIHRLIRNMAAENPDAQGVRIKFLPAEDLDRLEADLISRLEPYGTVLSPSLGASLMGRAPSTSELVGKLISLLSLAADRSEEEVRALLRQVFAPAGKAPEMAIRRIEVLGWLERVPAEFRRILSPSRAEDSLASEQPARSILRMSVTAERQPSAPFEFPSPLGLARSAAGGDAGPAGPASPHPLLATDRIVFKYTALSDVAVIPAREIEVQPYYAERLPTKLVAAGTPAQQEFYGSTLATYLLPADFRQLIDSGQTLALALDSTTAVFPWEMAAVRGKRETLFLGLDLCLTRQFRTLRSASPGIPPPLDDTLDVLIIADPNSSDRPLEDAREEAVALVKLFTEARKQVWWGNRVKIRIAVRIGQDSDVWDVEPDQDENQDQDGDHPRLSLRKRLEAMRGDLENLSLDVCDPTELLGLLLNGHYDVIHYSGHAVYDPRSGKKGWVLRDDCVLSATEILQTRNVPRLVFANACVAAAVDSAGESARIRERSPTFAREMSQYVSVVEAFFARGLPNYIGPGWGWEVPSKQACEFATAFYAELLGLGDSPGQFATFSEAMAAARKKSRDRIDDDPIEARIWCAYQHYGQFDARLVSPATARS